MPSPPSFGGHLPQRGRRDLVLRKQLVAHILGSPLGGAVAVRRLRGQPASAPHTSVSPRRRLYQRAVHAWGGWTGKLGGNLRGIEDAIKKPPARVSYGKQSTGLFSYFPALADATKTVGRCPFSAAASGAVCQWQTSSTDRRGSGDRALNGAHRAPAPPGEGFLRKIVHRTIFLFSCAC